jgi:hypothetical protein
LGLLLLLPSPPLLLGAWLALPLLVPLTLPFRQRLLLVRLSRQPQAQGSHLPHQPRHAVSATFTSKTFASAVAAFCRSLRRVALLAATRYAQRSRACDAGGCLKCVAGRGLYSTKQPCGIVRDGSARVHSVAGSTTRARLHAGHDGSQLVKLRRIRAPTSGDLRRDLRRQHSRGCRRRRRRGRRRA